MRSNCLRFLALLAACALSTAAAFAGSYNAAYFTGAEAPFTSNGYTATGNTVNFTLGYAPAVGTQLTVVQNTGLSFINGAFNNLAQGQTLTLGYNGVDYGFVANYFGGSENDLVLAWQGASVWGWGYNAYGELGNNNTSNSSVPGPVISTGALAGKTVVAAAAGGSHSVALCSDGTVAAWGYNNSGQLGNNSTAQSTVPVVVNTAAGTSALAGKTVVAVAAGAYHSLALCSDGTVAAWGDNSQGELGNNTKNSSAAPVAVNTAAGTSALAGKTVVAIAAGNYFSLALCSDGTVAAWGLNSAGELGNNTLNSSAAPVAVNTAAGTSALAGKTVVAIAAGASHGLALCSDGTVAAWGYNSFGELGNNTLNYSTAPVAVNTTAGISALAGKTAVAVAAGAYHSLALCSDGTVAAWGYNGNGQLGNNTLNNSAAPVAVNTTAGTSALAGKTVTAVAAGLYHSLAFCSDGTVAAWGNNNFGQLGIGSTNKSLVPVRVANTLSTGQRFIGLFQGGAENSHSLALVASPQVAFEANGGTGVMAPELATTATFHLTLNAFTWPGHTFLGWNTLFNGGGTAYADGASFTDPGSNVTLYAQWMLNAPSLTSGLLSVPVNGSAIADLAAATGASAPPAGGSFSFSSTGVAQNAVSLVNGKWVFNPAGLPAGAYKVVYAINDGQGLTSSVNFTINVTELPSLVVTTANDTVSNTDGLTSLREALAYAATLTGTPSITFGNGSAITGGTNFNDGAAHTITLNGTELRINSSVTISGSGANVLTISGNNTSQMLESRVFEIDAGNVTLSGLTVANGTAKPNKGGGGGIYNTSAGAVTLTNCTLSGNFTLDTGGGMECAGSGAVTLTNCTLSGNSANSSGAGIEDDGSGTVTLTNCTLSGNYDSNEGEGIYNNNGTVTLTNCTLSGNNGSNYGSGIYNFYGTATLTNCTIAGNSGIDAGGIYNNHGTVTLKNTICVDSIDGTGGTIAYGTDSIVGGTAAAAGLQVDGMGKPVLQNNGGPTQTIALVPGSPAIDAGNNALAVDANGNPLTTDQRGAPRIQRGFAGSAMAIVDIGAYESLAVPSFTHGSVSVVNGGTVNLINTAGVSPAGGTFTGLGAAAGYVDPVTGVFTSTGLGPGVYQVTYTVSDVSGASNSVNITVTVTELPSLVVTTANDTVSNTDGLTSLREALAYAATLTGTPSITFGDGSAITGGTNFNDGAAHTITLGGTELLINSNVTITGPGANVLAISGNRASPMLQSRVFEIDAGNVTLSGLTVANGYATQNQGAGGGIYNTSAGTVTLTGCTLSGNKVQGSSSGGGMEYSGSGAVTLTNCTISGNAAGGGGSGIDDEGSGTVTLTNCTLAGNYGSDDGGGIYDSNGTVTLTNCTLAGNSAGDGDGISNFNGTVTLINTICVDSTEGTIAYTADSIVGVTAAEAGLQVDAMGNPVLQNNGGPTQTIALVPGSPAIDAGNNDKALDANGNPLTTDQRGAPRIQLGIPGKSRASVDIGAYEAPAVPAFTQGSVAVVHGGTTNLVTAAGVSPTGGTFTGVGAAVGHVDPVTGVFNSTGLGLGVYQVTYTIIDAFGVMTSGNIAVTVAETPSLVVTTASDTGTNYDTLISLREALAYAATLSGPQTITFGDGSAIPGGTNFNDGAAHTITLNGTELLINSSVTIPSLGANLLTINGNNASRVIEIDSGNVTLSGLTVANGNANFGRGGGISNTSAGTVTLTGCTVSGNTTVEQGGGIYNGGSGTLTLIASTLSGNMSTGDAGGGIFSSSGAVTMTNCTLSGNSAHTFGGGMVKQGSGAFTVTNCTISGNSSSIYGGGIATESNGPATLTNCTFSGNSSGGFGGGGISTGGGTVTLTNCTIAGNRDSDGAGIYNFNATITLKNTICVDSIDATIAYGPDSIVSGTAAMAGLQVDGMGKPVLQNNGGPTQTIALVPGSPAIDAGNNALAVDANGNPLTTDQRGAPRIQRGLASSVMAVVDIGAYESLAVPSFTQGSVSVVNGGTVNLVNTAGISPAGGTFTGLGAAAGYVDPVTGVFNSAGLPLGVYQVSYTFSDGFGASNSVNITVTVAETPSLVVTTASDTGTNYDGLTSLREALAYAATLTGPQTITFGDGSAITGGTNFNDGAAHTITLGGTELLINSSVTISGPGANVLTISGNNASQVLLSRVFEIDAGNVTLSGLTVANGYAASNAGGGIYNTSSGAVTLTNCTLSSNFTLDTGGGMECGGSGAVTLTNCTISGNSANLGAGIEDDGSGTVTLSNCTISGNYNSDEGEGIYNNNGTVTLTNCTISGNNDGSDYGGGIYNFYGTATLTNCTLAGNSATDAGGIYNDHGTVTLNNTICVDSIDGAGGTIAYGTDSIVGGTAAAAGLQVDGNGNPVLQNNGGPTQTIALVPGSRAIDAGNNALALDANGNPLTTDQRGAPRIQRGLAGSAMAIVDIGAYESLAVPSFTQGSVSVVNGGTVNLVNTAGVSPAGGTFSGLGAAAGYVDPVTGVFNSAGLPLGVYQVTYTVSDVSGASNSVNITVTVAETPSLIVTTASDTGTNYDGLTSLREAIAYAATLTGPQTITFGNGSAITGGTNFNDGAAHTITLNGTELLINSSVTISGPGANVLTISGNNASRVIEIDAGNVTLSGLTVANGYVKSDQAGGGGIYNTSAGTVTLTGCTLSGNNVLGLGSGGGISSGGSGAVTLTGCTLSDNIVLGSSGGGMEYSGSGAVTLTNCTISGNLAQSSGCGIEDDGSGTVTLTNCTISGNYDSDEGAGIYDSGGTVTLTNCTLSGNYETDDGGGIYNYYGTVTLTNCTLAGNSAIDAGGIYNDHGTVTLKNTICVDSIDGAGGTIAYGTDSIVSGTATTAGLQVDGMGNPILQNNGGPTQTIALVPGSLAIDAGNNALAVDAYGNPLTTDQRGQPRIQRGLAGSAMAIVDIGAYEALAVPTFTQGSVSVVNGGTVNLLSASGVSPAGGTFTGVGVAAGHVDAMTGVFTSTGLGLGVYQVTYTVSDGFGGMSSANITVTVAETPSLIVTTASDTGTNYDGLTSLREALAYAATLTGPQTITFGNGSAITGGTNFNDGGAHTIALNGKQLVIDSNVTVTGPGANVLTIDAQHATRAVRIGNFDAVKVTVSGLTIANGTAGGNFGGGIYDESTGAVTLNNITLSGNTSSAAGGGGIDNAGGGTITLTGCTLSGNSAAYGGAIENSPSFFGTVTLVNSTLFGNSAVEGGCIDTYCGVTVINCTIAGNYSTSFGGGGIDSESQAATVTLENTICVDGISGTVVSGTDSIISGTAAAAGLDVDIHGNAILQYNGGPTQTIALLPGSPAIDAGNNGLAAVPSGTLTTDQRGFSRVVNGKVDIGAVEAAYTTLSGPATPPTYGQALNVTASVANATPTGGSVQFIVDGTNYGAPAGLVNGTASIAINGLSATTHSISAIYTNSGGSLEGNGNSLTEAVSKLAAQVNLGTRGFTYDGTQKAVSASTTPSGLAVTVTYNGSPTAPSAAGSYPVAATINDPVYAGSASGTLTIAKASSMITLSGPPSAVYTGAAITPFTAQVTGVGGLNQSVSVSYLNNVSVGTATVNASYPGDANHTPSSASTTFQINKATATVNLGTTAFTYDGTAKAVSASTMPTGLAVTVTYNGSPTAPSAAGSYPVVATINNANYAGSATGNLVIAKASSMITLSGPPSAVYSGAAITPYTAQVTGVGGLNQSVSVSYLNNVSAGTATVNASYPGDANHTASSASTTFQINTAPATVSLGTTGFTYDGTAKAVSASTMPNGLAVTVTYNGSPTAPSAAGSYAVAATISNPNYTGSTTGTLTIAKANSMTTLNGPASVVYTGAALTPFTALVTGAGSLSAPLTVSYSNNVSVGTASAGASYPGDANHNASSASTTFQIVAPAITQLSPSSAPFGTNGQAITVTGTNFVVGSTSASAVRWTPAGGSAQNLAVANVTATSLSFTAPATLLAKVGTASVQVIEGAAVSAPATFTITGAPPVITSVSPALLPTGKTARTVTLTGTGFFPAAQTATFTAPGGTPVAAAIVSSTTTQLTLTIPAGQFANAGSGVITITTGGGPGTIALPIANPAVNDTAFTYSLHAVTIDVLANDAHPAGGTLAIAIWTAPKYGTATIVSGKVLYTPALNFPTAGDSFTYLYADGLGGTGTATVTVVNFASIAGTYDGIFADPNAAPGLTAYQHSGYLSLTVSSLGFVTGTARADGTVITPLIGTLDGTGTVTGALCRLPLANLTATAVFNAAAGNFGVTVTSTDETGKAFTSTGTLKPAAAAGALGGNYTLRLAQDPTKSTPTGTGSASVSILPTGNVTIIGTLADGTAFNCTALLHADRTIAIYSTLYLLAPQGSLSGTITLPASPTTTPVSSGALTWFKPVRTIDWLYPQGFTVNPPTTISR